MFNALSTGARSTLRSRLFQLLISSMRLWGSETGTSTHLLPFTFYSHSFTRSDSGAVQLKTFLFWGTVSSNQGALLCRSMSITAAMGQGSGEPGNLRNRPSMLTHGCIGVYACPEVSPEAPKWRVRVHWGSEALAPAHWMAYNCSIVSFG